MSPEKTPEERSNKTIVYRIELDDTNRIEILENDFMRRLLWLEDLNTAQMS